MVIHPDLSRAWAQAREEDLARSARRRVSEHRVDRCARVAAPEPVLALRLAVAVQDDPVIARLAALDSASKPAAPVLLGLVDGEAVVALSLTDGKLVADPFRRTADVIDLLRTRARQLERPGQMRRGRAFCRLPDRRTAEPRAVASGVAAQ